MDLKDPNIYDQIPMCTWCIERHDILVLYIQLMVASHTKSYHLASSYTNSAAAKNYNMALPPRRRCYHIFIFEFSINDIFLSLCEF